MLIVMCSALFSPNGGGFLFTELLYVFLIASWIYPAFDKQKVIGSTLLNRLRVYGVKVNNPLS